MVAFLSLYVLQRVEGSSSKLEAKAVSKIIKRDKMPITATFGLIFGVAKVDVVGPTRTRGGWKYAGEATPIENAAATHITCVFNFCNLIKII